MPSYDKTALVPKVQRADSKVAEMNTIKLRLRHEIEALPRDP